MATVRLASITKRFGQTVAVDRLDLEVADGELVTLLGPSGCGKTTTLRMVAGLIEPTDGRVYFDADDVTFLPPRKRNIGFVFQTPALFPHLSVADNVAFGLSVKGAKKEAIRDRVDEMLALVGLSGYGARLPAQMSGGQQQRVALARVLATDPRVLLFDEPLSALDRNLRDTLKYSILDLQRRTGKTAIYVTHDQSEAFAISDRIVVMNAGRVEQIGTQTEIYLQPQTRFVAEFIGANNGLEGTVASVDGSGEDGPGDRPRRRPDAAGPRTRRSGGRRRGDRLPPAGGRPRPRGRRGHGGRPMAERRRRRRRPGDLRGADGPAPGQPRRTRDPGRRERQPAAHGRPGRGPDRSRVRRPHADPRGAKGVTR